MIAVYSNNFGPGEKVADLMKEGAKNVYLLLSHSIVGLLLFYIVFFSCFYFWQVLAELENLRIRVSFCFKTFRLRCDPAPAYCAENVIHDETEK